MEYNKHQQGTHKIQYAKHWHKIERAETINNITYLYISYILFSIVIFSRFKIYKIK